MCAPFPTHQDDDHGGIARRFAELGRPLGLTIVGGLTPPGRNTTRLGFIVFRDRESLLDLLDFFWRVFSEGPLQIRGESAEEVAGRV
jgi:hypothetical protein